MANLVAYFSATGRTKKHALNLAEAAQADVFEIEPEVPYTKQDLNWLDKNSRSSLESNDEACRPAIVKKELNLDQYDTIYLGFPIWWYVAPKIINTFLESYDFSNKRIVVFGTSGSSGFGRTIEHLKPSAPESAQFIEGLILNRTNTVCSLKRWIEKHVD